MSLTDRAFITAYEQPALGMPATATGDARTPSLRGDGSADLAPHFAPTPSAPARTIAEHGSKRPLSALLGERKQKQAAVAGRRTLASATPTTARFELATFVFPSLATAIEQQMRQPLASIVDRAKRPLAVLGVQSGSGATTMALALALSASHSGREALLIDASAHSGLAKSLGVERLPELASATATDDLVTGRSIRSKQQRVVLSIAGAAFSAEHAVRISNPSSKQAVIIDAGAVRPSRSAGSLAEPAAAWSANADFLLVDDQPLSGNRRSAMRALHAAGVQLLGVIENTARRVA